MGVGLWVAGNAAEKKFTNEGVPSMMIERLGEPWITTVGEEVFRRAFNLLIGAIGGFSLGTLIWRNRK